MGWELKESLMKVVRVLYYRYEFGRGCSELGSPFGTKFPPEDYKYDANKVDEPEILFPRIASRDSFLLEPGKPTYLDSLKADLRHTGNQYEAAVTYLKIHINSSMFPLCAYSPATWSKQLSPFFPSHINIGDRLLDYLRQLYELDSFLISNIGTKPGSLMPVWIVAEPTVSGDMPSFGIIPIRRSITDALVNYLLWEYGHDYAERTKERDFPDENNPRFLDNALKWGRVFVVRLVKELDIDARAEEPFEDNRHGKQRILDKMRNELPVFLRDFPPTIAEEVYRHLEETGEYALENERSGFDTESERSLANLRPEERSEHNREIVNSTAFRLRIKRAASVGHKMFNGDYKYFW
jgi:hypothetical protein